MKTPNTQPIVPGMAGPDDDDDDEDLRALTTVDLDDDDTPRCHGAGEFSNGFPLQLPRGKA